MIQGEKEDDRAMYYFLLYAQDYREHMQVFATEELVLKFINDSVGKDKTFKVLNLIRGQQLKLKAVEVTTKYEIDKRQ